MSDYLNQMLTQSILAAQARSDDEEGAAVKAAKAFAAGLAAFIAATPQTTTPEEYLQAQREELEGKQHQRLHSTTQPSNLPDRSA